MERVALIPGGARGIGRAIAWRLADQGWSVAICYRTSVDDAEETRAGIVSRGGQALSIQCDVSDDAAARGLVRQVDEAWGRIDALINCMGPYHKVGILKETAEGWRSMFDNNLHPVFYLSQAVASGMRERQWGRIVNFAIADAHMIKAKPMLTAHYIAKIGVLALTKSMARALARDHITVNCISPGFVSSADPEELAEMAPKIPVGYVGDVADVAAAVLFLLSEDARYITGGNLPLAGGWGL